MHWKHFHHYAPTLNCAGKRLDKHLRPLHSHGTLLEAGGGLIYLVNKLNNASLHAESEKNEAMFGQFIDEAWAVAEQTRTIFD